MGQRVLSFCTTILMAAVLIVCAICHRWAVGRGDRPHGAASPCPPLPRRRSSGKARHRRLVLALPDVLRCGRPARRRRNPRAPAARGADKGRDPQSGQGPNARRLNCGRARAAPQRARTPPRGSAAGRRSGAGPLRRAGLAQAEPHQRGQSRRRASAGRLAGARHARAGGPHRPKSPHEWGRGGPEHRRRNRRGAGGGQGPRSGPRRGLGLAARLGGPAQRLAAGKPRRGADLSRRRRRPAATTPRPPQAGGAGGAQAAQGGQG